MMNNYLRINAAQTINLNLWYTNNDKNIAPTLSSVASNDVADGNQVDKFFAATAEYIMNLSDVSFNVRSGLFNSKLDYEKPSWMQVSNSKATWWINELEGSMNLLNYFKVNAGVNVSFENASSSSFLVKEKRNREALFASVKYNQPDWRLSVSVNGRGEIVDGNGIPLTYSLGLEYTPIDYVTIKGNMAKNYRLPSFNDLFYKDTYSEGNPDLKPENGMNYEIGLELAQKNEYASMKIGSNLFLSRMDNWINWSARPDGVWSVFNIDDAEISGLETFIESNIKNTNSELTATVMFTYTDAKDKNTRKYISNVPKNKFTYSFKYRLYQTALTYQATQVGERFSNVINTKSIAAYNISNVILSQNIKPKGFRATFSVDMGIYNVFDKDYMVMDGYPMPKRNFRLGLRIMF
jgi:outer membrane cobalamin receptor